MKDAEQCERRIYLGPFAVNELLQNLKIFVLCCSYAKSLRLQLNLLFYDFHYYI